MGDKYKILKDEKELKDYQSFNKEVRKWTMRVRGKSVRILQATHSSGRLANQLTSHFLEDYGGSKAYVGLGFRFLKYGAYREYGAGRGYIVQDGVIRKGHSMWRDPVKRKELRSLGISEYRIRRTRYVDEPYAIIKRTPLPWLDPPITKNIDDLADISGEFYGDQALKKVLEKFNVITIEKRYGKK